MILKVLAYFFSALCIIPSLLSLIMLEAWWIRIFDFPRLQILIVGILSVGFFFLLNNYSVPDIITLLLLGGSIIFQMIRIFPYTSINKVQSIKIEKRNEANEIGVYITNVFMDNRDAKKCIESIKQTNPDIVLAIETNRWWHDKLKELENQYPYTIKKPLENTYGMILYSKFKLSKQKINYLVSSDIPSIKTNVELPGGKKIMFYGVHPKPPAPNEAKTTVKRDAELIVVAKDSKKQKLPVIVAGDLNDVAWSHTTHLFQRLSGLLDPRIGRGMYPTFNARYPIIRWPLDHLFHSADFQIVEIRRIEHIGSDHFPMFIKLALVPGEKSEQQKPIPQEDDVEEAETKIKKAEQE